MFKYYIFIIIAAVIHTFQIVCQKLYQNYRGSTLKNSILLQLVTYSVVAVFFFVKGWITMGEINFGFSWFTLLMTIAMGLFSLMCMYCGLKVVGIGNLSLYSIFMQAGGILLPSFVGILFYGEELGIIKPLAMLLMITGVALSFKSDGKKTSLKVLLFYLGVAVLNGGFSAMMTVHQKNPTLTAGYLVENGVPTVNSDLFMCWVGITVSVMCLILWAVYTVIEKRMAKKGAVLEIVDAPELTTKQKWFAILVIPVMLALTFGIGNYLTAISVVPGALDASVVTPIVCGGVIIGSAIVGFIAFKEKPTVKSLISMLLVIAAIIMFMFV